MNPEQLLEALRNMTPEARDESFRLVRKLQWQLLIEDYCGGDNE